MLVSEEERRCRRGCATSARPRSRAAVDRRPAQSARPPKTPSRRS